LDGYSSGTLHPFFLKISLKDLIGPICIGGIGGAFMLELTILYFVGGCTGENGIGRLSYRSELALQPRLGNAVRFE